MIAPSRERRKGYDARMTESPETDVFREKIPRSGRSLTDSLDNSTMKPNFEQPRALVGCEKAHS